MCKMELFSRISFGLLPLIYSTKTQSDIDFYNRGLLSGCDENSSSYWGKVISCDQRCVEMLPLCLNLIVNREVTWETYSDDQKKMVSDWMLQINHIRMYRNNWLFFRILVNAVFEKLDDGSSVPYGRSLTYQMALSAFCLEIWNGG